MPTKQKEFNSADLLKRAREGDREAVDLVTQNNLGLVWSVVRHFLNRGYEKEDLFQIGCVGLIKAISRFDPEYDTAFSTYAVPMITGEIKRFLRDDGTVKVSRGLKELAGKAYSVMEAHRKKTGEEPRLSEVAEALGCEQEELVLALDACAPTYSLSGGVDNGDDDVFRLEERIGTEGIEEPTVKKVLLEQLLTQLEPEEQRLIALRYFNNKTQADVAAILGVSQVQISRRERKILKKLRGLL